MEKKTKVYQASNFRVGAGLVQAIPANETTP
jgi:hypothetical protein